MTVILGSSGQPPEGYTGHTIARKDQRAIPAPRAARCIVVLRLRFPPSTLPTAPALPPPPTNL